MQSVIFNFLNRVHAHYENQAIKKLIFVVAPLRDTVSPFATRASALAAGEKASRRHRARRSEPKEVNT